MSQLKSLLNIVLTFLWSLNDTRKARCANILHNYQLVWYYYYFEERKCKLVVLASNEWNYGFFDIQNIFSFPLFWSSNNWNDLLHSWFFICIGYLIYELLISPDIKTVTLVKMTNGLLFFFFYNSETDSSLDYGVFTTIPGGRWFWHGYIDLRGD